MSKIIALQGKTGSGKSTTLKKLKDELCSKYKVNSKDVNAVLRTEITVTIPISSSRTVGIVSRGNAPKSLEHGMSLLYGQERCDIIFCAVKLKGATVKWLEEWKGAHPNDEVKIIAKKVAETANSEKCEAENDKDVQRLIEFVK
jgi:FMN-dependent NADH-azoreductase